MRKKKKLQNALAALDDQLETLADATIEGQEDIDLALAELLDSVPANIRAEIAKAFEEKVTLAREQLGVDETLTPEQQQTLRQLREHEEQAIAHMLARETRRKIRALFLSQPQLLQPVLNLGKNLQEKGIAGLGIDAPTPALPPKGKEKDRGPGR